MLNFFYTSNYNEINETITTQTMKTITTIDDRSKHVKIFLYVRLQWNHQNDHHIDERKRRRYLFIRRNRWSMSQLSYQMYVITNKYDIKNLKTLTQIKFESRRLFSKIANRYFMCELCVWANENHETHIKKFMTLLIFVWSKSTFLRDSFNKRRTHTLRR